MAVSHGFSFSGGEELSKMGATWFITYAYAEQIDLTEVRWQKSKTYASRASMYNRTRQYHHDWYVEITKMSDKKLETNQIGVCAAEAKSMAQKLICSQRAE